MVAPTILKAKLANLAHYLEGGGLPPYDYLLAKLCRMSERLPWELDVSIEPGYLPAINSMVDMLAYDDAWKQFIDDPEHLSDVQGEFIGEVRTLMKKIWGTGR